MYSKITKKYLGVQNVALEQIQGSVSRLAEAGCSFQISQDPLLARWREMYLRYVANPRPPLQVYKFGQRYFVEDGYHGLADARSQGVPYLQAEVWDLSQFATCECETDRVIAAAQVG